MIRRLPATIALALLTACSYEPEPVGPQASEPAPVDVISLSSAAVDVADTTTPSVPARLPQPMMADAVAVGPIDATAAPAPEAAPPAETSVAVFTLRHGETLDHFAKWAELPVEEIAEQSGLDLAGDYPVGTEVRIALDSDHLAAVEARREEHWTKRLDGYLASRGGALGVDTYAVRTGDTAWSIAKERVGVPMWVLAAYNPDVSLDSLRPGQRLQVPMLADTLADASPTAE